MTSRETTQLLAHLDIYDALPRPARERLEIIAFGEIQWPWLLRSLWGGRKADKAALLRRLDLADDALPHLGSWKADTRIITHIVDAIEELRTEVVVDMGWGANSLVRAS